MAGSEKKKRKHTITDFYVLPKEIRVEMIDGEFYEQPVKGTLHQEIESYFHVAVGRFVQDRGLGCKVFGGSVTVMVNRDDYNMVQPDFMVIFDKSIVEREEVYGTPEFILEICTDMTRERDLKLKAAKYEEAGVREYWVIDTEREELVTFGFGYGEGKHVYHLEDSIPMHIFTNELSIDLAPIADIIHEYKNMPE